MTAEVNLIPTTLGLMDETLLEKRVGGLDNEVEQTSWTEYWFDGQLVHRSVHVTLKEPLTSTTTAGDM